MTEIPANGKDLLLQQAEQTSDESEEEGVPMSRGAHIGIGLFASAFGGMFGGMPSVFFIELIMDGVGAIELILMGLFFTPFILIGGSMFIFGVVTLGAGIIGHPLMKEYSDEDEDGRDEQPVSTAFAYTSEDDVVEQIRGAKAQHAVAETSEKAPTLGWGMAPASTPAASEEESSSEDESLASNTTGTPGADTFWGGMTGSEEN